MPPSSKDITDCIRVLEALALDPTGLSTVDEATRNQLMVAAGRVSRPDRNERRLFSRAVKQKQKAISRAEDEAKLTRSGIRQLRRAPVFVTPDPLSLTAAEGNVFDRRTLDGGTPDVGAFDRRVDGVSFEAGAPDSVRRPEAAASREAAAELNSARNCYVCKIPCSGVHFFYDQMCSACGDFNFAKRAQTADLHGRVALISGARVKIGYQAAILLLRAGARVIVSTRFPRDAALRYAREKDYLQWRDRLQIYGLDLRHTPSVEAFARHLNRSLDRLDFMIHNACQTVRRPSGFYTHLMAGELGPLDAIDGGAQALLRDCEALRCESASEETQVLASAPARSSVSSAQQAAPALSAKSVGLLAASALSQIALAPEDRETGQQLFPAGLLDQDLQQVDLRGINSWRLALDQVGTVELLEVQLVNAIAPFVLNARLRGLMQRQRTFDKHIVNVSAMEGQFYRRFKTDKHPHTNMAKAALNMMTRTSAADYAKDGIFMNSVDTGWVTDEDPLHISERKTAETGFQPPLDIVDGAARIVDPIFSGFQTGRHSWGQFLKDYRPTVW